MKMPKKPYVVTSGHGLRRGRGRPPTLIMPARRAAHDDHRPAAATRGAVSEPPPAALLPLMSRAVPDPGHGARTHADPGTAVPALR